MKFFVFALFALAAVASARKLDLVLDGQTSSYTNVLAKQIAPLLFNSALQRQSLVNYRTVPLALNAQRVAAAPQIYTVAAPARAAAIQTFSAAAPAAVQYVQSAPAVQYVQSAPQVQYVQSAPQVQYVQQQATGPIAAAVVSQRSVQVIDAPSTGAVAPTQTVVIGPSIQPLDLEFQSQSSPVATRQIHIPGTPNPPQFSSHQDEPDILKQEIVKPIVHEVTEAIQPFRKITQEVRPVQETINQLLTRGQQVQALQAVQAVAAPAIQTVAAAPALVENVQYVQSAPALQTVSVQAAPAAVSSVEVVEEPVISTVAAAAPAVETIEVQSAPVGHYQTAYQTGLNVQTAHIPVTAAITRY